MSYDATIEPGHFVRHPQQPDWGIGQVQSVIDGRITVNFEHAGKVLVNGRVITLEVLHGAPWMPGLEDGAHSADSGCPIRHKVYPGMIDPFGRSITYLRVSVTDRCDLRCVYCMSEDMTFLPRADVLSLEELDRLCGAFIQSGVRKLRITGGEPLVRRNVMTLFGSAGRAAGAGAG